MNAIALAEYRRTRKSDPTYPAKAALYYAKQWAETLELEKQYHIEIEADQDDMRVRGNAMASGDNDFDRQVEDEIIARLDRGDVWAWAQVTVRVTVDGVRAEDHLGGCSYKDETDFKKGGYYYDMIHQCLNELESQIEERRSVEQFAEEVSNV